MTTPQSGPISETGAAVSQETAARPAFPLLMASLFLVIATLAVYWPVTNHDFVDYDDGEYVVANPHVQAGLTWDGVKWAFRTGHASNWHPLTWLSHMLDVNLFGRIAGGHHVTSLSLHCINVMLVFLLLRCLTGSEWRSVIVAALFALHPLHVESVAWVSERKDVLSACFGLMSLLAYALYTQKSSVRSPRSTVWYCVALGTFVLGLLSKPMLVTLPFVMLLLDWWPLQRFASHDSRFIFRRVIFEKTPFIAFSVASCVVTFLVQQKGGAVSPLTGFPLSARIANALVSYVRYLAKTFWPVDLSILYPHPGHWPVPQVVAAVVLLALVSAVAVICWKRMAFVTVGWFWFLGMLVPVIGVVQVGIQSMADRYTYLPLVGVFIAIVWSANALLARWPALKPAFGVLAILVLAICSMLTRVQVRIWTNSETLFRHAVEVTRKNYLAYNNLGFYLSSKGRMPEAMEYYHESLKIKPDYEDALNNLGHALAEQRKFGEAIAYYQAALRVAPNNVEVHNNLGNALSETGKPDEAIAHYLFVLQRKPDHADAHNNLGIALAMKGRLDEAMAHFNEALRLKPSDASAHGNLGNAFAAQRKFSEATVQYREALRLSPADAQTRNNLGNVLAEQGRLDEAMTNYLAALQLKPENPEAHFNAGCVLLRLGRREEAKEHLRAALRLRPDYPDARRQLENLTAPPPVSP